jgi:siroheme synthase (precorrin-2 oxidase/ferrochelatase)
MLEQQLMQFIFNMVLESMSGPTAIATSTNITPELEAKVKNQIEQCLPTSAACEARFSYINDRFIKKQVVAEETVAEYYYGCKKYMDNERAAEIARVWNTDHYFYNQNLLCQRIRIKVEHEWENKVLKSI